MAPATTETYVLPAGSCQVPQNGHRDHTSHRGIPFGLFLGFSGESSPSRLICFLRFDYRSIDIFKTPIIERDDKNRVIFHVRHLEQVVMMSTAFRD